MFINYLVYTASTWTWILYLIKYRVFWTPVATVAGVIQRRHSNNLSRDSQTNNQQGIQVQQQQQTPQEQQPESTSIDDRSSEGKVEAQPESTAFASSMISHIDDTGTYTHSASKPNHDALNPSTGIIDETPTATMNGDSNISMLRQSSLCHVERTFSLALIQEVYHEQLQQQPTSETYRQEFIGLLYFILDNPRHLTTHLFSPIQTKVLAIMVLTLITIQYVFFLASTLTRRSITRNDTLTHLAGLGYFQTLSIRSAGFNILDLRSLNQGLLFVYGIMMYLSAFPFVTTLQSTTQSRIILIEEHGKELQDELDETNKPCHSNQVQKDTNNNKWKEMQDRKRRTMLAISSNVEDRSTVLPSLANDISLNKTINNTNEKLLERASSPCKSSSSESSEMRSCQLGIDELAEIEMNRERERVSQQHSQQRQQQQQQQGMNMRERLFASSQIQHQAVLTALVTNKDDEVNGNGKEDDNDSDSNNNEVGERESLPNSTSSPKPRRRRLVYSQSQGSVIIVDEQHVDVVEINKKFAKQFLFRHSFILIVAVLICAFSEDRVLSDPTIDVNLWYIMCEIISAYGNVGLTFGMPGEPYSLVGGFTRLGKFVVICIMWLGKHRGLPSSDDDVIDFTFDKYKAACRSDTLLSLPTSPIID